jgi:hypothetical protein
LRSFRGFAFYLLLPLAMFAFWWKAAVFPKWGWAFAIVTAAVVAMHLTLLFHRLSWTRRAVISLGIAILPVAACIGAGRGGGVSTVWLPGPLGPMTTSFGIPFRRPFNLFRANLADQWLVVDNLKGAYLIGANLSNAELSNADLSGAELSGANLSGADLTAADLSGAFPRAANLSGAHLSAANLSGAYLSKSNLSSAELSGANLSGANLYGTNLSGANLSSARLNGAEDLSQQQLDSACGDASTRLPPGLSVKFCK